MQRIVGHVSNVRELAGVMRARRVELGIAQRALDHVSGLQEGYTGKLECGARRLGPCASLCCSRRWDWALRRMTQARRFRLILRRCTGGASSIVDKGESLPASVRGLIGTLSQTARAPA
jgi:hypothetical protein